MIVWYKEPRLMGHERQINGSLESLQELVDGPIEVVRFKKDSRYALIVNEEGMLRGDMVLNLIIGGHFLFGPVVIVGLMTNEDGEQDFCSVNLNMRQVRKLILNEGGF